MCCEQWRPCFVRACKVTSFGGNRRPRDRWLSTRRACSAGTVLTWLDEIARWASHAAKHVRTALRGKNLT